MFSIYFTQARANLIELNDQSKLSEESVAMLAN